MLYYVTLTQVCGLKCIYCQNTPDPRIQPISLSYDLSLLKRFIEMDPEPYICFYGGDPLTNIDLLKRVMDEIPAKRFIIQTNGLNLHKLDGEYLQRIDTLLVSLDGREETTDYYRGMGVYRRVLENVRYALSNGFKGDLIARMAVSGKTDVFLDVVHLLSLKDPKFNHVHWQLDVLWDYPPAQRYSDFDKWIEYSYNPGISRLVKYWLDSLLSGNVLGIVPFKGIIWSMLTGENMRRLRCGSGIDAFSISTDGRIVACPIAPEYSFNIVGDIRVNKPEDLPFSSVVGEPCISCDYYDLCGGRCLFANKTMLWGEDGFRKVCRTVIHLINELKKILPVVEDLIEKGIVDMEDLRYPPYINTVEIIP